MSYSESYKNHVSTGIISGVDYGSTICSLITKNNECFENNRRKKDMSSMILLKNKNGIVLASDSRLNIGKYKIDNFQKVFFNKEKSIIWGITGFYGYKENLLKKINNIINNNDLETIFQKFDEEIVLNVPNDKTISLFVATKDNCMIIDFYQKEKRITRVLINDGYIWCAGAHNYMSNYYSIEDINKSSLEELVNKAYFIIKKEKEIDEYIFSQNNNFDATIGGNIYSISMDKYGNIKTFINDKETLF